MAKYEYSIGEDGSPLFRTDYTNKTIETYNGKTKKWEVADTTCGDFLDSKPIDEAEAMKYIENWDKPKYGYTLYSPTILVRCGADLKMEQYDFSAKEWTKFDTNIFKPFKKPIPSPEITEEEAMELVRKAR